MSAEHSKHGGARVRFPPPLVFLGLMALGEALQRWGVPVRVPLPLLPRVVVGAAVTVGGVALLAAARLWFKRTGQDPRPWRPSPELLVQGIYRYTRNPMYLGMTAVQLGLGVALGRGWIALLAPLSLALVHVIAVLPEEAYLTAKFGEAYVRYRGAVRRYL